MVRSPFPVALVAAALLAPAGASADRPAVVRPIAIYVNDVRVDGLRGQTLTNVDVRFDEAGDLRITARNYKVKADPAPAGPQVGTSVAEPALSGGGRRYWIATAQLHPGAAQWNVSVYINRVFVKKFRSKDADPVYEITNFLRPGPNVIHFEARKEAGDRTSMSPTDYFELVVGDGEKRAGQVMLNRIASYRRTADETGAFDSETTIELKASP